MKKKSASAVPIPLQPFRKKDRGISKAKKEDIIKKLVLLMPANRNKFWNEIAVTDQSPDLIDQDDPWPTFLLDSYNRILYSCVRVMHCLHIVLWLLFFY